MNRIRKFFYYSNIIFTKRTISKIFKLSSWLISERAYCSLEGIVVFGIHEFSKQQIDNGSANEDKEK